MNKSQVQTFWKELRDDTNAGEVVKKYRTRQGYGGERTLDRYVQAYNGFLRGRPDREISKATGWSTKHLAKIRPWCEELVGTPLEDEWDVWRREHLRDVVEAIESYKLELAGNVRAVTERIYHALDFEGEDRPYGALQKKIIATLERRDDHLVELEQSLNQALGNGGDVAAKDLLEQICQALDRWT